MYGPPLETAHSVAFNSCQLKAATLNYPVHEKELLAILCMLRKWCVNLLGVPFTMFTNYCTLENFGMQKHLSRRQAYWKEFLGKYNFKTAYIKGELNTTSDALLQLSCPVIDPVSHSPATIATVHALDDAFHRLQAAEHTHVTMRTTYAAVPAQSLHMSLDPAWLAWIWSGYTDDCWCICLLNMLMDSKDNAIKQLHAGILDGRESSGVCVHDGLLFVGRHLCIPCVTDLCKRIF